MTTAEKYVTAAYCVVFAVVLLYVAIIATLGEVGLDAVTTNLNINFLAKPEPRDLVAKVNLIRLGRRLAVGETQIYSGRRAGHGGPRHRHLRTAGAQAVRPRLGGMR